MNSTQTCYAEINGTKLYYEMKGEGQPVLLIHGLPVDSRMWDDQFEELSKQFKVIRFDLPGYGRSGVHNEEYSFLDDIKALLSFLQINKTSLIGLSVGGKLSIEFTLAYPDLVNSLVLASSGLTGWSEESPQKQKYNEEINECYQDGDLNKIVEHMCKGWVAGPFRSINDIDEDIKTRFKEMVQNTFAKQRGKGKLLFPDTIAMDLVDQIHVPTLIISSELDFPEFEQIARFLCQKIKDSKKITLEGTAHMLNMEKPIKFNEYVVEFLNHGSNQ